MPLHFDIVFHTFFDFLCRNIFFYGYCMNQTIGEMPHETVIEKFRFSLVIKKTSPSKKMFSGTKVYKKVVEFSFINI